MKKIRLFTHTSAAQEVLETLQKEGVFEIREVSEDIAKALSRREQKNFELNYESGRLDFAVTFLSKFEKPKGKLRSAIEGTAIHVSESDLEENGAHFLYHDIVDAAEDTEEILNKTAAREKELLADQATLQEWKDLDIRMNGAFETARTKTFLLSSKDPFNTLVKILKEELGHDRFATIPAGEMRGAVTVLKEDESAAVRVFRDHNFESIELPAYETTPKQALEYIQKEREIARAEREKAEERAKELANSLPELKKASDVMFWKKERGNTEETALGTGEVLVFEGWCVENALPKLEQTLSKKTTLFEIEHVEPNEGEEPPVEIHNSSLVRPFEAITRLYGLPGGKDLDPTAFLAGFFILFFGLSLTDFGYGAVLAGLTGAVLYFYKVPKDLKLLLSLLFFGGISTMLIGMLFGGYFGIDPSFLPQWMQDVQKFDPLQGPIAVLLLTLALGVVQIVFGLILKIVRDAKEGRLTEGLLDQGPWLMLFASLGLFGAEKFGMIEASYSFVWPVYLSLAAIVLSKGRKEKNPLKKVLVGILGLYDSVSYFSDVLSYSRLLALGLATSALAFAVNLIAQLIMDMVPVPVLGTALAVGILIIGHIFNLAVNVLGAFIQSARLQFIEFFGKFITGTGKNFVPFRRVARHVALTSEEDR